jgi:micrococcal nuclease
VTAYTAPTMHPRTCTVLRVVDGDTLHVLADLGCDIALAMTVRLYGVNAPERGTPAGPVATRFVQAWLAKHGPTFELRTVKDSREKFGRYLADLVPADGTPSLCSALLTSANAVIYLP